MSSTVLPNYVGGVWEAASATETIARHNPATGELVAQVPLSSKADVDQAVRAALAAWPAWRRTPAVDRVQHLFKLKTLLEGAFDDIARTIVMECGKTLTEARGELRRGIENVEVACGIPSLSQGYTSEDIASGIDEILIRQPLGVVAAITPFNFPGMIPLWFLPYAVACGNCFILKPSERVPLTMHKVFALIEQAGFPAGVLSLVNGGKDSVDALLDHPDVSAISFVGSSPVARYIYARAAANGKRVQCQGGAKNPIIVMPDADMDMATRMIADAAFGCAGQRCLAASVAIPIGEARELFTPRILDAASSRRVGYGLDEQADMGPVVTDESRARIESLIGQGERDGDRVLIDGRQTTVAGYERGHFVRPTVLETAGAAGELARTEIFGPVLALRSLATLDEAIEAANASAFGNMVCVFTASGAVARKVRYEARAGNIGVNVAVAAPMAFFPFSGWKGSFFGDLHAQGRDAVEFYTDKKVIVERWPPEWSRTF